LFRVNLASAALAAPQLAATLIFLVGLVTAATVSAAFRAELQETVGLQYLAVRGWGYETLQVAPQALVPLARAQAALAAAAPPALAALAGPVS